MHMKIRIRYFASLREITGQNEELLMVDERTSVADIRPLLVTRYPRLQPFRSSAKWNQSFNLPVSH